MVALSTVGAASAEDRPIKRPRPAAGVNAGQAGVKTFAAQVTQARFAPYGSVAAGEYSEALAQLQDLPSTYAPWFEVTNKPYDSNDPNYRDPIYSNSGAGWGNVAGRVTGLAVGGDVMFAGGANGGIFRRKISGRSMDPDLRPDSLTVDGRSSVRRCLGHALVRDRRGEHRWDDIHGRRRLPAAHASHRHLPKADRVGGDELESRGINQIKFDGAGRIYAATTRGLWRHSTNPADHGQPWELVLMPNPASDTNIEYAVRQHRQRRAYPSG